MNIYSLTRPAGTIGYDEAAGFVVVASSSKEAREIAANNRGDEGSAMWLEADRTTCQKIGTASLSQKAGKVLRDFRAG
ncbi:MAG TPA: hypothetical protein VLA31_04265 [Burkholderiaceae bacterium]|nr:hypothetical protein [Burkholderiaceae bacterium]